jgi:hypothetical protein
MMRNLLVACLVFLPSLANAQTRDACALLASNPSWRSDLVAATQNWDVSAGSILAVLDQESRFVPNARGQGAGGANPQRNFGFAQANLQTWNWFLRDTGKSSGSRTDFGLSADFVGWHFAKMERRIGVSRSDFVAQYLVYKMGEGGYRRGAPASSRALAQRIAGRARAFDDQLARCPVAP